MPRAVVFPFDLFGNAGTGAGALLLGDVLREVIDDTAEETTRTVRQHAFADRLQITNVTFDTMDEITSWRSTGRERAGECLEADDFTFWLAGNHLGVLPVYDVLGPQSLIIQFDAHLDCYAQHDTLETLSHGNFLLHRKEPRAKLVNIGHRDLFLMPADIRKTFTAAHSAEQIHFDPSAAIAAVNKMSLKADRVWIDVDIDVFDPAVCPAVHQPSPFGLSGGDVLQLLSAFWSSKIAGVSFSEYDPGRDVRDTSLTLLGWLLEWLLLKQAE